MQKNQIDLVFSPEAEALVGGYQGVAHFEPPAGGFAIGDTVRLRMEPGSALLEFVCTARLFDYESGAAPRLQVTLSPRP